MQTIRMASKRKLWQEESTKEAVAFVQSGSSLRQAAKLYNVPVETLRRCSMELSLSTANLDHLLSSRRMKSNALLTT